MATNTIVYTLSCKVCKDKNYSFRRGIKKRPAKKLEINKYCKKCGKTTPHREIK
ncbi:MAG: 50S ribosomal protein L33 [bacterium]